MAARERVRRAGRRLLAAAGGPTRHDLVLAVIPAAFVVAALLGGLLDVPARDAVAFAAAVGGLAMSTRSASTRPAGRRPGGAGDGAATGFCRYGRNYIDYRPSVSFATESRTKF